VVADARIEQARLLYERMAFSGDGSGLATAARELDGVEADLSLARGRVLHGQFMQDGRDDPQELTLFGHAADLYQALGDTRGEGESLLWIGIFHQVVRQDNSAAVPMLERSRQLLEQAGDEQNLSYALRHLGIAEHSAGRLEQARQLLEDSTRLRRDLGFLPGVAANLVGLGYIAAAQDRRDEAMAMLREAAGIAKSSGAYGIARQVDEARRAL
jgi:tetratricopeptide (TPR) repeat protein